MREERAPRERTERRRAWTAARAVAAVAGAILVASGLWAFLSPSSFFDSVATWPPYNRHFIHDVGAFQVGLGATLLLALVWSEALLAALAGNAAGAVLHAISHFVDRDLGGRATDPITLALFAGIVVLAAWAAWRRWRA